MSIIINLVTKCPKEFHQQQLDAEEVSVRWEVVRLGFIVTRMLEWLLLLTQNVVCVNAQTLFVFQLRQLEINTKYI